jgi:two-component system, NtrC family, sensor histidine kinase HydH
VASSAKNRNALAAPIRQFLETGTTIEPRTSSTSPTSTPTSLTPGWTQSVGELEMESGEVEPIVFHLNDPILTRGENAIDIRIPIQFESQNVGYYHTAIGVDWLESKIREAQWNPTLAWLATLTSILLIVLASSASLFRLGSHAKQLEQALQVAETRRLADLSRLIVGMAHELRNPLNAVRLNLFTSEKLIRGESKMPLDEAVAMLHESVSEVERVSEIISQLLGYARVRTEDRCWLNLDQEIRATLQFMNQIHVHHGIKVQYENLHPRLEVYIEQKCLRQVFLNLLMNARQVMPMGGRISIHVESRHGLAQIVIDDDGPGIQSDHMDKIFEPFFTTRQDGVGLGLAVVRNLIEAAGGKVICGQSEKLDGLSFCIQLPSRNVSNVMTTSASA